MKAKILAAIVAMMMVAVMAMPTTALEGADVPTSAQINGVNTPPMVQYVWELPDDDLNTPGTQVEPTPGGITEVYKYIVVYHPVSEDLIDNVKETTYYPDGTEHSWSWAVKLDPDDPDDMAEIEQAKADAVASGFITQDEANEIDYLIDCNLAAMYKEINYMHNCDPPGIYTVKVIACTTGGTYSDLHTHEFLYLSGIAFLIDFDVVNYGLIVPDVYKEVCGDLIMTTPSKPTIENICNDPFELCVSGTDMVNTVDSARTIAVGCLDVKLGDETIFPLTTGMQCFPTCIGPCPDSLQCMGFSIEAPPGTCGGIYEGTITLEIHHCTPP